MPREARAIPPRQLALRLILEPAPSQFDQHHACLFVARFAYALISMDLATGIGARRQSKVGRQMLSVLECSVEHFGDQVCSADFADAIKLL